MVPASAIAMAQAAVARSGLLSTPCTIQRLSGSTYAPVGTTTCFVTLGSGSVSYPGLPSILSLSSWEILVPWDTGVSEGDRLVTPTGTYVVQSLNAPATDVVVQVAVCYQLYDASGAQTYLPTNSSISQSRRDRTVVTDSRRVRLVNPTPTERVMPDGAVVDMLLYDVPDGTYTLMDIITILAMDGHGGVPAPSRYSVGAVELLADPIPMIRVQLSSTNR